MAIAPLIVSVRTTGANALTRLGQELTRTSRTVSSVSGAYRSANGVWRNANGTLVMQRNHLRQNTTALGHLATAAQHAFSAFARLGSSSSGSLGTTAGAAFGAAFAVAAGAAINAALVTAIGGATMVAGIVGALKSDASLRGVFKDVFAEVGADFKRFSGVFVQPLLEAAAQFRDAWSNAIGPGLSKAFADLAPHLTRLSAGFAALAANAMPGFNKAVAASGGLLDQLSSHLPRLGDAFSSFFASISRGGDGMAKGLYVTMAVISESVRFLGNSLELTSRAFDFATDAGEKFAKTFALLDPGSRLTAAYLEKFNQAATKTTEIIDLYANAGTRADYANKKVAESAGLAAKAAADLSAKLAGLVNDRLSATEAELAWQASIDALTASFREHGKSVNADTEAGRANIQSVLDAVRAAEAKRQATIALAGGERASAEAVQAANATFSAQLDQLRGLLRQLGLTEAQVNALLASYQAIAAQHDISKTITITIRQRTIGGRVMNANELASTYSSGIGGRAAGGPVKRGQPYIVGEKRAELFVPDQDGRIVPRVPTMTGGGPAGAAATTMRLEVAAGADSAVASMLNYLVRTGVIRWKVVNGRVAPA